MTPDRRGIRHAHDIMRANEEGYSHIVVHAAKAVRTFESANAKVWTELERRAEAIWTFLQQWVGE